MKKQTGLTLLELMFALTIASIIVGIGVPSFVDSIRNSEMVTVTNTFISSLHSARGEAVKSQARVTVCRGTVTATSNTCSASGKDLLVFTNINNDASIDGGDTLILGMPWLEDTHTVSSNDIPSYVTFTARGVTQDTNGNSLSGDVILCGPGAHAHGRVVNISPTGRPSVTRMTNMANPPSC